MKNGLANTSTIRSWTVLGLLLLFFSCEKNPAFSTDDPYYHVENTPSQVIINAHMVRKDSGRLQMVFKARLVEKYELPDSAYMEANRGLFVASYKAPDTVAVARLWADSGKVFEHSKLYTAKGNVKIITKEGTVFRTNSVCLDDKDGQIRTRDTVYVTQPDGTIFISNKGMISNKDFTEYKFYHNTGETKVKKDQILP